MVTMIQRIGEEAKSDYIKQMGQELGIQFYRLWEEFLWLDMKWGEYDAMYGAGSNRIDLLNEAAPTFFWMVEKVFWEDMLLHISRLTDPPSSNGKNGKKNLTIKNLPELVSDPAIKEAVNDLVGVAENKTKFCRDWRDRYIAHRDLDLAINVEPARPLESANRQNVFDALIAIRNVLMELEGRYMAPDSVFLGIQSFHGATDLLQVVYFGIKEQAEANKRIRVGQATEEDYPALYLRAETEPNIFS